ncbi:helix-turn-helix transcriptional regulator [Rhizobium sp. LjRoot254]|uniref:helix-turn-helix transcriptional regulator n=1 Tax=Rhizobium sp. LjRoot254 TaxID=3342297 RepID=UPI003ECD59CC
MSRSERLLELIQTLRRHRRPVSGQRLAEETGVSLRTLYRDVATLQAQGADIEGEPGMGYILKPGFLLPPLMFSEDEIEALVLGSRWVANRTDSELSRAAANVLAKIAAVLPDDLKPKLESSNLLIPPAYNEVKDAVDLSLVRKAIRNEHMVDIGYVDAVGAETQRRIWPFALGYYDRVRVIAAWCEMRNDFRNFRTDRIQRMEPQGKRYPRRKAELLKAWRIAEGVADLQNPDNI